MSAQTPATVASGPFATDVRDLVEDLRAIIWEADAKTWTFTWVSRYAEEVLGYPMDHWLHEPGFWETRIHPADRESVLRTCLEATGRGENHQVEYRAIAADGRIVWLRDIVRLAKNSQNEASLLRGVTTDITERKAAEAAARDGQEQFRQLAENIPKVFWMGDAKAARLVYVSPAYEEIWGQSCQSLYDDPRAFLNAVHPDDRAERARILEEQLEKHLFLSTEFRIIKPDGQVRWIRDRNFPVWDAAGEICRIAGVSEDITEQKQAELVLRESEERFRKLFEEGTIPMAFSGPDLHILKINQAFCRMLGREEEELTKHTFFDFTHPDDIPRCREFTEQNFAGLTPNYRTEKRYFASDGQIVWVDLFSTVVRDSAGTPLYNLGMAVDITERKRTEQALHELSARLMRLQDEAHRNIARELHDSTGQNLAALKLNLSRMAQRQLPPELAEIVPDSLGLAEKILSEVRTLAYLLHPPLLDELGLACALHAYVQGFGERSGILVQAEIQPDLGRLAPEFETTIFRIIQEALTNVHRHSGAKQCWVSLLKTPDAIALQVRDDGIGLRPQSLQLLKTGAGLLGVGLSGMQERVRQLGGVLDIESAGTGCLIRATFSSK
jgi:PAS domain S-box-containing protein